MNFKRFIPGIIWLIVSFILLALPGDDLPHVGFFNIPYFDKCVHTGMFFMLTMLFTYPFFDNSFNSLPFFKKRVIKMAVAVIFYGITMEFFQKYFSQGRSFDVVDIVFDSIGSCAAGILIVYYYQKILHKKIGPDGNRGRNQN
ncbi:MAG TPA: VanZ family protein [Segetibacter sp.]